MGSEGWLLAQDFTSGGSGDRVVSADVGDPSSAAARRSDGSARVGGQADR